jgi:quinol monooxygenase YgiN
MAEDVLEPGVIRIVERWRDWQALTAHDMAPHVLTWRAALKEIGVVSRNPMAREATNGRPI